MACRVLADTAVSVSELKRNPSVALDAGQGRAVAIMNHNRPTHYAVPAAVWEQIQDMLEDAELNTLCDARSSEVPVPVSLDSL
jgi:antitoxin StbD